MAPPSSIDAIRRTHFRITTLTALGILLTSLLTGLAAVLPFYMASRDHIEAITRMGTEAQAQAIHNHLARYQDIARQFASRTEIRHSLEDYAAGKISLEDVRAYTAPRLADAVARASMVVGMVRLGPQGEEIVRLGLTPPEVRTGTTDSDYPCRFHYLEDNTLLLQACAPILDHNGQRIGSDLLMFDTGSLLALLQTEEQVANHHRVRLQDASGRHVLIRETGQLIFAETEDPGQTGFTDDREHRIVFEAPLGRDTWQLMVEVPSRQLREESLGLLLWPAITVVLLTLSGTLLLHRGLRPLLGRVAAQAEQLELSGEQLRQAASVFRHASEAILITDPDNRIVEANPAFADLTGHSHEALPGKSLAELLVPEDDLSERIAGIHNVLRERDSWQGELHYRRADGATLIALQTITGVRSADGRLRRYIHIFNDITTEKHAEAAVRHRALHDELTGLPNRTRLMEHLGRAVQGCQSGDDIALALLFLDLDHFKEVNDTLGHRAGDLLLQAVSSRLQNTLRAGDLLARLGGDEFIVVLNPIHSAENATRVAENLIEVLVAPFDIEGHTVEIGVSIGIALCPDDGVDADGLLRAADAGMYQAKSAGRNTWRLASDRHNG